MKKREITVEELLKKTSTMYHLVNLAGKRARSILMQSDDGLKVSEAIDRALEEIADGKVRIKSGVKKAEDESKQGKSEKPKTKVRKIYRGKKSK